MEKEKTEKIKIFSTNKGCVLQKEKQIQVRSLRTETEPVTQ